MYSLSARPESFVSLFIAFLAMTDFFVSLSVSETARENLFVASAAASLTAIVSRLVTIAFFKSDSNCTSFSLSCCNALLSKKKEPFLVSSFDIVS